MIVLIQGPPGAGKTTLGRRLSRELGIPHLSKDDVKEVLFDALGSGTAEWSSKLSKASNRLLLQLLKQYCSCAGDLIVESNFYADELAQVNSALAAGGRDVEVVEVFLTAPRETLLERFERRWQAGQRHPGHADAHRHQDVERYIDERRSRPVAIRGRLVRIDTAAEDPAATFSIAMRAIERARSGEQP